MAQFDPERSLPPALLVQLERLNLVSRRRHDNTRQGSRASRLMGSSIEYSGYREYTPGDDWRHLDWNIYARLNQLQVKLREAEEALVVWLLLDGSSSMDGKLGFAAGLAAAVGYVALTGGDEVRLSVLREGSATAPVQLTSRRQFRQLTRQLAEPRAYGTTDLAMAIRHLLDYGGPHGVCLLISDLLDDGAERALAGLAAAGHETWVLHVQSRFDRDPDIPSAAVLVDAETGAELTLDGSVDPITAYRSNRSAWFAHLERYCLRASIGYLRLSSEQEAGEAVLGPLRRRGLLR